MPQEIDLLGNILKYSALPISLIDPASDELRLTYVNRAFETTTGYRIDEALAAPCPLFTGASIDPMEVRKIRKARDECRSLRLILTNTHADGRVIEFLTYVDPIFFGQETCLLLGVHFPLATAFSRTSEPAGDGVLSGRQSELQQRDEQHDHLLDYAKQAMVRCLEMRRNTLYSRINLYLDRHKGVLPGDIPSSFLEPAPKASFVANELDA